MAGGGLRGRLVTAVGQVRQHRRRAQLRYADNVDSKYVCIMRVSICLTALHMPLYLGLASFNGQLIPNVWQATLKQKVKPLFRLANFGLQPDTLQCEVMQPHRQLSLCSDLPSNKAEDMQSLCQC